MKTIGAMLLVLTTFAFFSACGGEYKLKVEGLDDLKEDVKEATQTNGEDTSGTTDDGETGETAGGEDGQGSDDTTGGLEYLEPDQKLETPRYFMGTYELLEYNYYSGNGICEQGFPVTIRLYSHDEVIDFETSRGELFTTADLFEDNTFDFDVAFLDRFGKPSVDVICTCHFNDGYYQYTNERFLCTCDPSNSKDSCGLIYEKLETDE